MFLACPACSSRFRVNPHAIGDGRDVRCSKCGNEWFALKSDIHDEHGLPFAPPPAAKPAPKEEEEAPPARPQPVPKEYESEIGMPLGDELPSPEELAAAEASAAASYHDDDDEDEDEDEDDEELDEPRIEEPLPDIDFDALDKALASNAPAITKVKVKMADDSPRRFLLPLAIICTVLLLLNIITAMLFFREPIARALPATLGIYKMFGYHPTQGLSFSDLKLMRFGTPELPRFDVAGAVLNGGDRPLIEPDIRIAMVGKDGKLIREWQMSGGDKKVPKAQPLIFSTQNEFLRASRSAEAEALILQLGSPLELSLSDQ